MVRPAIGKLPERVSRNSGRGNKKRVEAAVYPPNCLILKHASTVGDANVRQATPAA